MPRLLDREIKKLWRGRELPTTTMSVFCIDFLCEIQNSCAECVLATDLIMSL